MLLSEYYKNSKYADNGTNYEIIEYGKNQRSYFKLLCVVCSDVNFVTAASVLSGRKPCLCSQKAYKTPEKMLGRLLESIENKPLKLLQEKVVDAKSTLKMECLTCGKVWNSSYNSIVLKGSACPLCSKTEKLSEDVAWERLNSFTEGTSLTVVDFSYQPTGSTSKCSASLLCRDCGYDWVTSYASISAGRGCPSCARHGFQKSMPASLYVLKVISPADILIGYKYGITCDLDRRIQQHNKLCKPLGISFDTSFVWRYGEGSCASEHERVLKNTFKPYFKKYELPSGFTETIGVYQLGELLDIQNSQYRKLKWQILV